MQVEAISTEVDGKMGLQRAFQLAGAGCILRTNSTVFLEMMERCLESVAGEAVCELHVIVTEDERPAGELHMRGMQHVVVISRGVENIFVLDLRRRVVTARIGRGLAKDVEFWRWMMLPMIAGILGPAIGVMPAHSACLARVGNGMMIVGESGAGKSTLSAALTQRGFDYIADDWTYCSIMAGELMAWGTGARIKLLPDAVRYFPVLTKRKMSISMNGELAFEVSAMEGFGAQVKQSCRPRMLVFLRRNEAHGARFERLDMSTARQYFEQNVELLPRELIEAEGSRAAVMDAASQLPCWGADCGGPPAEIAAALDAFYEERRGAEKW